MGRVVAVGALTLVVAWLSACTEAPSSEPPVASSRPTTTRAEAAGWPLACTHFPPGDEIAECARRGTDGRVTVRPEVAAAESPEGGLAVVLIDGEPYYVNTSGVAARTLWYDNGPDPFASGVARTVRDGKIGFVDENLVEVIPATWDFAFPFEGGFARVCTGCTTKADGEHGVVSGGTWGFIDRQGEVVVPVIHERDDLPPRPVEPGQQ